MVGTTGPEEPLRIVGEELQIIWIQLLIFMKDTACDNCSHSLAHIQSLMKNLMSLIKF